MEIDVNSGNNNSKQGPNSRHLCFQKVSSTSRSYDSR